MIDHRGQQKKLYWSAFLVRFGLGMLAWILVQAEVLPLLRDALYYEQVGLLTAREWLAGRDSLWLESAMASDKQAWLLVVLIACFYFVLGGIRTTPLLMAAYGLITAIVPVLTYRIAREIGASGRGARFAGYLIVFSPIFAFWSGALYKEGLILLALNLVVLHSLYLLHGWSTRSFAWILVGIAALLGLRFYLAVIVTLAFALGLLMGKPRQKRMGGQVAATVRQGALVAAFLALIGILGLADALIRVTPESPQVLLSELDFRRSALATASSGYLPGTEISTPAQALRFAPIGTFYFLTVPWPWQIGSVMQNLVIPETTFWLLLYPLVGIGIVRTLRTSFRETVFILGFTVAVALFYGLLVGNIGIAYRMRSQVWLFWAIFAGIGWDWWRGPRGRGVSSADARPQATSWPERAARHPHSAVE